MNRIEGRPDFDNPRFGITRAKRHPKYVYGSIFGSLIHEINYVEFRWYELKMGYCIRLDSPRISATTKCGMSFFVSNYNSRGKASVCEIPKEDAVLCKACRREGRNFPKNKKHDITKQEAKARIGCNDIIKI
jgi:hypothetical protein